MKNILLLATFLLLATGNKAEAKDSYRNNRLSAVTFNLLKDKIVSILESAPGYVVGSAQFAVTENGYTLSAGFKSYGAYLKARGGEGNYFFYIRQLLDFSSNLNTETISVTPKGLDIAATPIIATSNYDLTTGEIFTSVSSAGGAVESLSLVEDAVLAGGSILFWYGAYKLWRR